MPKQHLLIADDDPDLVDLLTLRCESLGLQVDTANNAMTALGKVEEQLPDLVILDVNMPLGTGLGVCEMMAEHEELQSIPVVVLTGESNDDIVRRCHQLCAYNVPKGRDIWSRIEPLLREFLNLGSPDEQQESSEAGAASVGTESAEPIFDGPNELMDAVFTILGVEQGEQIIDQTESEPGRENPRPWILSIEDDDDVAFALRLRLEELGFEMIRAVAGKEGYRRAFLDAPQAILLDYELPEGNGDYVLRRLKETPATSGIPVIVLTGRHEKTIERQMQALGANEFLTKPIDWRRLRKALREVLQVCSHYH